MSEFTHFNTQGRAKMVDVGLKLPTVREAAATATVRFNAETFNKVTSGQISKGDVLAVAQVAGIMAAKKTGDIIPMCHPLALSGVDIGFESDFEKCEIRITAAASCTGQTGVEMEAMTAVSVAALTIYDMCKAVQRDIEITQIRLLKKSGGKTGVYEYKGD